VIQLIDRVALVPVDPSIVDQYDVVEPEALRAHVQEPHGHCTRPHHEADELGVRSGPPYNSRALFTTTYQVDVVKETPISQAVSTCIARLARHEVYRKISACSGSSIGDFVHLIPVFHTSTKQT
jgi:hypothetical protein